jgi:hypothetical protein
MWLNADTAEREKLMRELKVADCPCHRLLKHYIDENSNSFPMLIGQNWDEKKKSQMAIFLVSTIE